MRGIVGRCDERPDSLVDFVVFAVHVVQTIIMAIVATPQLRCLTLLALLLLRAGPALAGSLTLAWDPNSEPDLAGYILAYGTEPGSHPTTVRVGTQSSWEVSGLIEGQRYYFVVYAFNTSGASSPPSNEVSGVVAGTCRYGISSTRLLFDSSGGTRTLTVTAPAGCGWTATTTVPWLTLTGGSSGTGDGSLAVTAASQRASGYRVADLHIGAADPMVVVVVQRSGSRMPLQVSGDADSDNQQAVTMWRPGSGTWYVDQLSNKTAGWFLYDWGGQWLDGQPVPGDYDGDGIGDYAVWRSSEGMWHILTASSNFTDLLQVQWGGSGDLPVPADYDGDGRTDIAVWRPATGIWHVKTSASDYREHFTVQWGVEAVGDQPAVGDYDGDGRADIAVWRSTTGFWFILRSHVGYSHAYPFAAQFGHGSVGDQPIVGDFDGDGATDIAVWRQAADAVWYVLPSSGGLSPANVWAVQWGRTTAADQPVVLDFDRDGRSDVAVWQGPIRRW